MSIQDFRRSKYHVEFSLFFTEVSFWYLSTIHLSSLWIGMDQKSRIFGLLVFRILMWNIWYFFIFKQKLLNFFSLLPGWIFSNHKINIQYPVHPIRTKSDPSLPMNCWCCVIVQVGEDRWLISSKCFKENFD